VRLPEGGLVFAQPHWLPSQANQTPRGAYLACTDPGCDAVLFLYSNDPPLVWIHLAVSPPRRPRRSRKLCSTLGKNPYFSLIITLRRLSEGHCRGGSEGKLKWRQGQTRDVTFLFSANQRAPFSPSAFFDCIATKSVRRAGRGECLRCPGNKLLNPLI
jgi:hypothetical protein